MGGQLHVMPAPRNLLHREPTNPRGFKFSDETTSPYLNAEQAARYLQYFIKDSDGQDTDVPNVRALYKFLKRKGITPLGGDRRVLVDRRELDAALDPVKTSRAHRPAITRLRAAVAGTLEPETCMECGVPLRLHLDARGRRRPCTEALSRQHAERMR